MGDNFIGHKRKTTTKLKRSLQFGWFGFCALFIVFFFSCARTPEEKNNLTISKRPLCRDMEISLAVNNEPFREIINKLKDHIGYFRFDIDWNMVDGDKIFSFDFNKVSIFQLIDILSRKTNISIKLFDEIIWFWPLKELPQYTIATDSFLISVFIPVTINTPEGQEMEGALCRCEYYADETFDVQLKSVEVFSKVVESIKYTNGIGRKEWLILFPDGYDESATPDFRFNFQYLQARERFLIRINDTPKGAYVIDAFELEIEKAQKVDREKFSYSRILSFHLKKKDSTGTLSLIYAGSESGREKSSYSFGRNWSFRNKINGEMHIRNEQELKRNDLVIDFALTSPETVRLRSGS